MRRSILLIEPEPILARAYQTALESSGHKVVWCRTAAAGVAAIDSSAIDLVVLELNIAGHNGVEFLYEIRSYKDLQLLPVIIHSTIPRAQVDTPVLSLLGIAQYLYKPTTSLEALQKAVANVLRISV